MTSLSDFNFTTNFFEFKSQLREVTSFEATFGLLVLFWTVKNICTFKDVQTFLLEQFYDAMNLPRNKTFPKCQ